MSKGNRCGRCNRCSWFNWCSCCSKQKDPERAVRNRRESSGCPCTSRQGIFIGVFALFIVIIVAITLSVTLPKEKKQPPAPVPLKWWKNGTFYRVYVASFADSDGDGIGDFKGEPTLIKKKNQVKSSARLRNNSIRK